MSVDLIDADDLLAMPIPEVEAALRSLRRTRARLAGYEAVVVDALEVLRLRARPAPPDPDPTPASGAEDEPGPESTAGTGPQSQPDQDSDADTDDGPEPSRREQEQMRKRAALGRDFPKVAAALRRGTINLEQFDLLTRSGLGSERVDELLEQAIESGSADATRHLVQQAQRDEDETSPRVRFLRQQNLRRFSHGIDENGNYWFNLVVDPIVGETILKLFERAERSQWQRSDKGAKQHRTPVQRSADAFASLVLDARTPRKPKAGDAADAGAHLVIDAHNLLKLAAGRRDAVAHTLNGQPVPGEKWQQLVDRKAEIFAWVLAADGAEVNLARSSRHATEVQKLALAIRDGGCFGNHCDRTVGACDAHHLIEWENNGPSDIALLALGCPSDHSHLHKTGSRLQHGERPGDWMLANPHTGEVVARWSNPLPPWRR
ncbi:MAG: DUF222 domain-containing protein [Acidimicrobiales bacterium]